MADRELKPTHGIVEPATATEDEHQEEPTAAPATRFVSTGTIPGPLHGFQTPRPTASTLAYGNATTNEANVASKGGNTTQNTRPEIQMPDEYVGKRDTIEMGDDYVGPKVEGGDFVNYGPLCERPDAAGACYLTPTQRAGIVGQLNRYVPLAAGAYHAALQNARIDELLKKAPQLGIVAELLIGALGIVSGTLMNAVMGKAIQDLAEKAVQRGAMNTAAVAATVAAQSGHVRNIIAEAIGISKGRAKLYFAGHTPQSQVKVAFLEKLQNEINPMTNSIAEGVLDTGDDAALVLARHMFDPLVFTEAACTKHVNAMVDLLAQQHIDDIGSINSGAVPDVGTTEVVRLQSWGKQRLALMKFFDVKKMGRMYGDDLYSAPGTEFVNWIEDDFGDFATTVQESRHGSMKTIDVSLAHRFGPEVQGWVERTIRGASR